MELHAPSHRLLDNLIFKISRRSIPQGPPRGSFGPSARWIAPSRKKEATNYKEIKYCNRYNMLQI